MNHIHPAYVRCVVHALYAHDAHARRYSWDLGEDVLMAGIRALHAERRKPNFGIAGAVNNLLSAAAERMEARLKHLVPAERARAAPIAADLLPPKSSNTDTFGDQ